MAIYSHRDLLKSGLLGVLFASCLHGQLSPLPFAGVLVGFCAGWLLDAVGVRRFALSTVSEALGETIEFINNLLFNAQELPARSISRDTATLLRRAVANTLAPQVKQTVLAQLDETERSLRVLDELTSGGDAKQHLISACEFYATKMAEARQVFRVQVRTVSLLIHTSVLRSTLPNSAFAACWLSSDGKTI